MNSHDPQNVSETPESRPLNVWSKLGGGALTFAVLFHLALLILAAVWIFTFKVPGEPRDFIPLGEAGGGARGVLSPALKPQRAPLTPSSRVKTVIAQDAFATFVPPEPTETFGELAVLTSLPGGGGPAGLGGSGLGSDFGTGDGLGRGNQWGGPNTHGKLFGPLPMVLGKRCAAQDRLQRLRDNGGTPACEEAVLKGLRWLKSQQKPDGSWGDSNPSAMTGLALLAYFGHCETPASVEFGDSALRGIVYLVDKGLKNDGRLAADAAGQPFCYEHAIATYAMAEAVTFCKDLKPAVPNFPTITDVTRKAGQFIIDNQHKNGGWAYKYDTYDGHTDVSVVGWQVQALKACSHTGLKFQGINGTITRALAYLNTCQDSSGGYGYTGPGTGAAGGYQPLTGVGMLCNQMWDKGKSAEVRKAAKYISDNSKLEYNSTFADLYGHYYESQAMIQRGGAEWKKYNDMFRDQLLNNQDTDGSWKTPGGGNAIRGGPSTYVGNKVYRTALCTLMLEVYYRFLNTGGGTPKGRSGFSGT